MLYFIFLGIQLILVSIYDFCFERIPNKLLISIFIISFSLLLSSNFEVIFIRLFSAFVIFFILYLVSKYTKGLGAGDVKLIAVIAFSTGFFATIFSLLIACILGIAFFSITKIVKNRIKIIPFAPFISAGVFIMKFIGEPLLC